MELTKRELMRRNYLKSQFKRLSPPHDEFYPKMQVMNSSGTTNWLDITNEQLEQIKKILMGGK